MKSSFGCLLIEEAFIHKIKNSSEMWGYINGFQDNDVFGALSVKFENKDTSLKSEVAFIELYNHRSFEKFEEKIILWVRSDGLFKKVNSGYYKATSEDLKEFIKEDLIFDYLNVKSYCYLLIIGSAESESGFYLCFHKDHEYGFGVCDLEVINEKISPFNRIDGFVPLDIMKDKNVALVGIGSGGSYIALELASAGLGTLHVFDNDRISINNIFRHVCDKRDLGRKKVDAISDIVADHFLPTKVIKHFCNVVHEAEEFKNVVNEVDLVICATDNVISREYINYTCVLANKPLVMVGTYNNALIGEVIKVEPYKCACYECIRIHQREQNVIIDSEEAEDKLIPYSHQIEVEDNSSIGTRTDVFVVASLATKIALMSIIENSVFGYLQFNYITWGATRNKEFKGPFDFDLPFSTKYTNYAIHPKCPVCGDITKELCEIDIEDKYNEIISEIHSK